MMARRLTLAVTPELAGRRVDALLRQVLGLSGTVIRRVKFREDGILLDGERVFTSAVAQEGQTLSVLVGDEEAKSGILPSPGPLDIVYEDGDLMILNKAPGVPVHPGPGHFSDTIGNFVMNYYKKSGESSDFHPVHRLDRGTSGLLVIARHAHAQEVLKKQLHTGDFHRGYRAVCDGAPEPPAGTVDAPIGRRDGSLMEREVRFDGLPARTRYETLARCGPRSLLSLTLETGRTHQIRVHMAHLGCPLTGDFLYGREDPALIPRPALHSAELALAHPVTGARLRFSIPLPEDMARLL